jgi:thioredoxin reductase (NADPH)
VTTHEGGVFCTKTLFLATGVGAFQPRAPSIAGIETFYPSQLCYDAPALLDEALTHQAVVILGGSDAALQCAVQLAQSGADITLVYRRDVFEAPAALIEQFFALRDQKRLKFMAGQITGFEKNAKGQLTALHVIDTQAMLHLLPVDTVLSLLGLVPKLTDMSAWGLQLERKQMGVDAEKFQTNLPGVFAVGDANCYPGKRKLILSGFHEATLAAFAAAAYLQPNQPVALQYTTTSKRIHRLLGV